MISYLNRKKTKKKIQSADKRLPASVLESNLKVQVLYVDVGSVPHV